MQDGAWKTENHMGFELQNISVLELKNLIIKTKNPKKDFKGHRTGPVYKAASQWPTCPYTKSQLYSHTFSSPEKVLWRSEWVRRKSLSRVAENLKEHYWGFSASIFQQIVLFRRNKAENHDRFTQGMMFPRLICVRERAFKSPLDSPVNRPLSLPVSTDKQPVVPERLLI